MSIFKEAAKLADEWALSETASAGTKATIKMVALLRAIAAMDVEVEPAAYRYTASKSWPSGKWHYQEKFPTWDNRAVVEIGDMEALYTQQSLDAAILKAHDAAIEKAAALCISIADDYDQRQGDLYPEMQSNAVSGAEKCADQIRELKGQPWHAMISRK